MKTRMMRLLYGQKMSERMEAIDHNERQARRTHAQSIRAIANARESADNLKRVLEINHISIQIHNATGNKNNALTPYKPKS